MMDNERVPAQIQLTIPQLVELIEQIVAVAEVDAILCVTENGTLPRHLVHLADSMRVLTATSNRKSYLSLQKQGFQALQLPAQAANRYNQIRVVLSTALKSATLSSGQFVLCVFGPGVYPEEGAFVLLTHLTPDLAHVVTTTDLLKLTDGVQLNVLETALALASKIGRVTRYKEERKGAIFMSGDSENVLKGSHQLVPNPFHGHKGPIRQITCTDIHNAIVEFAKLDGAFVIHGDGYIESAGVFLAGTDTEISLPIGLGARHQAAAATTARTQATAVVVSATDGNVRVFSDGTLALKVDPAVSHGPIG